MPEPTDHVWVRRQARDQVAQLGFVRCAGACDRPAVYLLLWNRPDVPTFCSCGACRTTPACAEHVAIWRTTAAAKIAEARSMPDGWHPDDGWPGGTT